MIPLSRWLAERADDTGLGCLHNPDGQSSGDATRDSASVERMVEEAFAEGRKAALAELDHRVETARMEERSRATVQLDRTEAIWRERCAEHVTSAILQAIDALARNIEHDVADLLSPFLAQQIRENCCRTLGEMITKVINAESAALIEVRAPVALHASLDRVLSAKGIDVPVVEAERIDVVFSTRTQRFEDQLTLWANTITGPDHA